MSDNISNLRKILIIGLSIMIMAAVFVAGLTIAALGFIFLPLLFFRKNNSSIAQAQKRAPFQNQTIDAEFKRIEDPINKE